MTNRISLNRLAFSGPNTPAINLEFADCLNLVFGASNTGKSFGWKAIDFALGASTPLPDIEQRRPFDRLSLAFACGSEVLTLSRALVGGNLRVLPTAADRLPPPNDHRILGQKNDPSNEDNVSQFLLGRIGLRGKMIATNASGAKRALSFRDLSRYCLVDETSIQSELSPALSGQHVSGAAERSVLKLLLTGMDDSAVVEVMNPKTFRASKAAKLEVLDDLLQSVEAEIESEFPNADKLKDQDDKLNASFETAQADVDAVQLTVRSFLADRRHLAMEVAHTEARMTEVEINLQRFARLHEVYQSDIERLEALEEAGFILAIGGGRDCPLCGASPEAQKHEHGLGDIEKVRAAATVEIAKIKQQQMDLSGTVQQLYTEGQSLREALPKLIDSLTDAEAEIARLTPEIAASRRQVTEIMTVRDHVKRGLSLIEQRNGLLERKTSLAAAKAAKAGDRPRLDLSSTAAHEFAQSVSAVLTAWQFPGQRHVSFDDSTFDLKIDGKHRRDNGKGVRAITHAAFKVALLLYCRDRNLPHPGFLVLDTPLLTYRDPITSKYGELSSDEQEIAQLTLKNHFFEHLSVESRASQFIVLENIDPPANIDDLAHVEVFYGDRSGSRQGLFPPV